MKTTKTFMPLILAFLFFYIFFPPLSAISNAGEKEIVSQKIEKEFKAAMGGRLKLDLEDGGDISITGWAQEIVMVKVFINGRDWDNCKVDFGQDESGLVINENHRTYRFKNDINASFTILVPRKFNLEINSAGGGIVLNNIEGVFNGETKSGALNLSNLKGEVHLTTMSGNVTVKNSEADGEVKTMGGHVLIEDVIGALKGLAMSGKVTYKNVTDSSGSSNNSRNNAATDEVRIQATSETIEVEDAPAGADLKTLGGNIHIHKATGFVRASTMGGNINIDNVDGWVEATTMSGDVNVVMSGDPAKGKREVLITSLDGDISLTIPPALSMTVDIKLEYTKNSLQNYVIRSDFPVEIKKTTDWDYSRVTARKFIFGTGQIAGGKNKIKIETINGNVYLKKGKK